MQERFIAKSDIVLRDIHSTYYLVDIKCNYRNDFHRLPVLDEVGKAIWESLLSPVSIEDIIKRIKATFEVANVSESELQSDISEYISMLISLGYVKNVY